jgi:CBS domain-containing protein
MTTVRQLLQSNTETSAWSVTPQATCKEALQLMAEKNVGAVTVVENGQMIGIFSERDYARLSIDLGKCSLDTALDDVMTREMIIITPDQSLEDCMALMAKWHIRHLPVMNEGRLIGMVSMRDVMEAIISKKETTIENLENYILGKGYIQS